MKLDLLKIKNFILDLLFPLRCLACQKEGFWLCPACLKKIKLVKKQTCPGCRKESAQGKVCPACRKKLRLDGLLIIADYKNEIIQQLIHLLKYKFAFGVKEIFRTLLGEFISKGNFTGGKKYLIMPVPLHNKRLRYRGFNQSEIIGQELAALTGLPLDNNNLIRRKNTIPQVKLSGKERSNNILNAFALKNPLEISGQSVILVDDVYTTGSTMNECAKVLKKTGAKEVIGFAIARG